MDGRCQTHEAAHVSADVSFATKPQIARQMIARAIAAKVPFSLVAADSVYGTGEIETSLLRRAKALYWRRRQSRIQLLG